MGRTGSLSEVDLDALKRGEPSNADEVALQPFVTALRAEQWQHDAPAMSAALRAQIAAVPVVAPARAARRWKLVLAGAAGLLVGGATLGVAGAQGALPDALQDATSRAAGFVGADFPTAAEAEDEDRPTTRDDDGTTETPGSSDPQGPPVTTKNGTTPADPGTPGDREPATPATPADPGQGKGETGGGTDSGAENRNLDPGRGNQGTVNGGGRAPTTTGTANVNPNASRNGNAAATSG